MKIKCSCKDCSSPAIWFYSKEWKYCEQHKNVGQSSFNNKPTKFPSGIKWGNLKREFRESAVYISEW